MFRLAWTLGLPDNRVSRDDVLAHLRLISSSVEIPVNADFEGGFRDRADDVGANVALATKTGVARTLHRRFTGDALIPSST